MKRSSFSLLLSAVVLAACSTSGGNAGGGGGSTTNVDGSDGGGADGGGTSEDPGTVPSGNGKHDAGMDANTPDAYVPDAAVQVTPDGCVLTASPADDPCVLRDTLGVFVSASKGSDTTGDGTMALPFATAAQGITYAKAHQKRVFLCAETYTENVTFENGVSVFGGLDCSQAKWTVAATRAHFTAAASPAARADSITTQTSVEALEIFAPDAATASGSSIGMIADGSPALNLRNVWIQAGNAQDGDQGTEGAANGVNGIASNSGGSAQCLSFNACFNASAVGSVGGVSACGANGGDGGSRGYYQSTMCGNDGVVCMAGQTWFWKPVVVAGAGNKLGGAAGKVGAPGTSGGAGTFSTTGFLPGDGKPGMSGTNGTGGSGGDGMIPAVSADTVPPGTIHHDQTWNGEAGAGGGAGGCGGNAGTAGKGGGASVALVALSSPMKITASKLTSGTGGNGGAGTFGSAATLGGNPGSCAIGTPTTCGTKGGNGGEAGFSGSGAGGHSVAIAATGTMPVVDPTSTLLPGTAGTGQPALSQGAKNIPLSANGVSQATYTF
jgi:hypothetical protein